LQWLFRLPLLFQRNKGRRKKRKKLYDCIDYGCVERLLEAGKLGLCWQVEVGVRILPYSIALEKSSTCMRRYILLRRKHDSEDGTSRNHLQSLVLFDSVSRT
jgi:hypothetical protein